MVRLTSKGEVQTRHPREHNEERKAVMSPRLSKEGTYALAWCLPPNQSTAWRGGVDRARALRLGLVARGGFRLGIQESKKRSEQL